MVLLTLDLLLAAYTLLGEFMNRDVTGGNSVLSDSISLKPASALNKVKPSFVLMTLSTFLSFRSMQSRKRSVSSWGLPILHVVPESQFSVHLSVYSFVQNWAFVTTFIVELHFQLSPSFLPNLKLDRIRL